VGLAGAGEVLDLLGQADEDLDLGARQTGA
jgi:hypothetical protein